jgi:hypothetical protein
MPPPSDASSRKAILIVLLAVVGVGAVGFGLAQLLGGDGRSPEDTVRAFWEADDCPTLVDLMTENSWFFFEMEADSGRVSRQQAIEDCESSEDFDDEERLESVELVSQEGDRATVEVTRAIGGDSETNDVVLRREDGEWKVDIEETMEEDEGS